LFFFFQAEDGIRDFHVTGVQTCALPISHCARTDRPPNRRTPGPAWTASRSGNDRQGAARPRAARRYRKKNRGIPEHHPDRREGEIGRAACRERAEGTGSAGAAEETIPEG